VERAGEGQRRRARAAAGLKATRGSYQSRRWRQQSCSSGERWRPATASSCWRLGQRCGVLGGGQREEGEVVGELEGDAWRQGEAAGGLGRRGTAASGGAAARQRGAEEENDQNKSCRTFQTLQLLFRVQIQKFKR
jgi:hypothetical protein